MEIELDGRTIRPTFNCGWSMGCWRLHYKRAIIFCYVVNEIHGTDAGKVYLQHAFADEWEYLNSGECKDMPVFGSPPTEAQIWAAWFGRK